MAEYLCEKDMDTGEYISRDLALRQLNATCLATDCDNYNGVRCRACAYADAMDFIEAIPAADVQPVNQWISVKDRLPKTGESVLVYIAINKNLKGFGECKPEIRIGWLDDGDKWALQFSNMKYSEVLCWMPLPKPPKDGDTNV